MLSKICAISECRGFSLIQKWYACMCTSIAWEYWPLAANARPRSSRQMATSSSSDGSALVKIPSDRPYLLIASSGSPISVSTTPRLISERATSRL